MTPTTTTSSPTSKGDLTPLRLAATGLLILIAFLTVHALGWRAHTSWLSGTASALGSSAPKALTYATLYFLAWFLAPIYFLAALIHWALFSRKESISPVLPSTPPPTS